jgi:hypothetical protein
VLERVELATKRVSGEEVRLGSFAYPVRLEDVEDVDDLRRAIQRGQGNNPTRRIRLRFTGGAFARETLHKSIEWLELGTV